MTSDFQPPPAPAPASAAMLVSTASNLAVEVSKMLEKVSGGAMRESPLHTQG